MCESKGIYLLYGYILITVEIGQGYMWIYKDLLNYFSTFVYINIFIKFLKEK